MTRVAVLTALTLSVLIGEAAADIPGVELPGRARTNYMLNCQGCHGPAGEGTTDGSVPVMKDFIGNFLSVPGGREFLVRVPGSANAALNDEALAEVLNWIIGTMAGPTQPEVFKPYAAEEVGSLRRSPLTEIEHTRADLLKKL